MMRNQLQIVLVALKHVANAQTSMTALNAHQDISSSMVSAQLNVYLSSIFTTLQKFQYVWNALYIALYVILIMIAENVMKITTFITAIAGLYVSQDFME